MLKRDILWVARYGELDCDVTNKASYMYVGGSPITIDSNGKVSPNLGATQKAQETSFVAVAWHNLDYDDAMGDKATIIFPPAILWISKGTDTLEMSGTSYSDGDAPFKSGVTYAVGDLLRPTLTTGTPAYAQWTNEAYNSEQSNVVYPYPAKILEIDGSASSPTALKIILGTFYKEG